ncbi:MAG TPA: hypothetical protein VH724_07015, partial [Candidatus Angelobacter sp.]|nr:hypothetical protein [Candidatus Angelobacter sp.]
MFAQYALVRRVWLALYDSKLLLNKYLTFLLRFPSDGNLTALSLLGYQKNYQPFTLFIGFKNHDSCQG